MHTLIVDDQPANRHVLLRMLSRFGPCEMAEDGQQAIAALRRSWDEERTIDLICLDIMMPVMNGSQTLSEIRKLEAARGMRSRDRVKVFMVTAIHDPDSITNAFCDGCTAYIAKPVEYGLLLGNLVHLGLVTTSAAKTLARSA